MTYSNIKVKVCSPDRNTDFLNIVAGVLQGYTLAPYLFIICLYYVLRMLIGLIKKNGFILKKARSRWYSIETIMNTDYADDIALLTKAPILAESLLHNLE